MEIVLHTIQGHQVPAGTLLMLRKSELPGHVEVDIRLPWQAKYSNLGSLPIKDGIVVLPVKVVFLCHANEDKEVVKKLGDQLLQDGYIPWFDDKDLVGATIGREKYKVPSIFLIM
jgi:hypothetical protein